MKNTDIYLITNCYGDPFKVYIGKTINKSRINDHKRKYGQEIEYSILDRIIGTNKEDWKPLESYWINQFKQWGFKLQNTQMFGGSGVDFHKDETKKKIKTTKSKKPHPNLRKDVEENKKNIIKEYESGDGVHIISSKYSCHIDVIKRILKEGKIELRTPSESQKSRKDLKVIRRTDLWDEIEEIKRLRSIGFGYTKIGRIFNTSDVQIKLMLTK